MPEKATPSRTASAVVRLVMTLRDGPERAVSLDFADPERLARQLETFERARAARPRDDYRLYEFDNANGETIAFLDRVYLRHEIVRLDES